MNLTPLQHLWVHNVRVSVSGWSLVWFQDHRDDSLYDHDDDNTAHHSAYLSPRQEEDLKNYCIWMADHGWPLTTSVLRQLAREILEMDNNPGGNRRVPTLRWAQRFTKRHELSKRVAKQKKSHQGEISKDVIQDFFSVLSEFIFDYGLTDNDILNMNETGWGQKQEMNTKYIMRRGHKNPYIRQVFSVDHITSVHCGTASGRLLPPMVIFKQSFPAWGFVENLPNSWVYGISDSGYMVGSLFFQWVLLVLVPYAIKRKHRILCVIDNASCHMSIQAIDLCKKFNIELLALPPNCTWLLQPFDQIFNQLKVALYNVAYENSLLMAGNKIHKNNFVFALKAAIGRAFSTKVVSDAFRITGIFPTNIDILDLDGMLSPNYDNPSTHDSSSPNNSQTPCATCGAVNPCQECVQSANLLVKLKLVRDPICQTILTPPLNFDKVQKKTNKIRGCRVLTSDKVREELRKKDKITECNQNDGQMTTAPSQIPNDVSANISIDSPVSASIDLTRQDNTTTTASTTETTRETADRDTTDRTTADDGMPTITAPKRRCRAIKRSNKNRTKKAKEDDELPTITAPKRRRRQIKRPNDDIYVYDLCHSPPESGKKATKKSKPTPTTDNKTTEKFCTECGTRCDTNDILATCTKCTSDFHYDCLTHFQQAEADLMRISGGSWMCLNCKQHCIDINESYMCQVCLGDVAAYDTATYVKCDNCTNVHHYWCLGDEINREIAKKHSMGQQWLCNTCR